MTPAGASKRLVCDHAHTQPYKNCQVCCNCHTTLFPEEFIVVWDEQVVTCTTYNLNDVQTPRKIHINPHWWSHQTVDFQVAIVEHEIRHLLMAMRQVRPKMQQATEPPCTCSKKALFDYGCQCQYSKWKRQNGN